MVQKRMSSTTRKRRDKLSKLLRNLCSVTWWKKMRPGKNDVSESRRSLVISPILLPEQSAIPHTACSRLYLLYISKTLGLILLYYVFSIGMTFYQKKFIHEFKFPLMIVIGHFAIKFALAALIRGIWWISSGSKRVCLSCQTFVTRMGPTGIAAGLDIGLSQWSFLLITISLYTMTKTTAIIFILLFSLLLKLEKFRWSLVLVVGLIFLGLFLFTFEATQFDPFGFALVLGASVLSGIRWTLSQCLMQRKDFGLGNPIDMIFHIQPWMFITVLPLAVVFEGKTILQDDAFDSKDEAVRTILLVLGGGVGGFLMEISEFILLTHTSSLTLSVAGISKEILQFLLAYELNGDKMTALNFAGLVICMSGVVVHVILKLIEQNRKLAPLERELERLPLAEQKTMVAAALLAPEEPDDWDELDMEEIDLTSPHSRNLS